MFIENAMKILGTDAVMTVCLCFLGCLSVAIVMRFFVKQVLNALESYLYTKHEKDSKVVAIYRTVKAGAYTLIAFVLTAIVLDRLMKVCVFPLESNRWLFFLYLIPMLAVQMFLDKHMKKLACKCFGLPIESEETEDEAEEQKPKKVRIYYKKVPYTKDADGNEVLVEE